MWEAATRTKARTQAGQKPSRAGAVARSSPPAAPACSPRARTASRLRGARAAARGTHLIHRSWAHSRLDCTSAPGSGGALGRRNSGRAASARARRGVPPALRPAAGRSSGAAGSAQRAAGRGASERPARGSRRRAPGSAPPAAVFAKRVPPPTRTAGRLAAPGRECGCTRVWGPGGRAGVCFISFRQKKA